MLLLCAAVLASGGWTPPPSPAPPPAGQSGTARDQAGGPSLVTRPAKRAVVIPLEGEIDRWTAVSIDRRIKEAEEAGADAFVIELDTPGGEVGATLEIANSIKGSSISNSVAWVRPDAYSGGAVVALACARIVMGDPGAIGDAFQVIPEFNQQQGRGGLRAPTATERTKILSVIVREVVDSARRNGYDESLVQAMVIDGVELWLVERGQTGEYTAIGEREYRLIFGTEPPRGTPELSGVTGGRYEATDEGPVVRPGESVGGPSPVEDGGAADDPSQAEGERYEYIPASEMLRDVEREINSAERTDLRIEVPSRRPNFVAMSDDERSEYRLAGYLTDGTAAVILRTEDAVRYGLASETVTSEEELSAFFGGAELVRSEMSGFEHFARFLSSMPVKFVLIAVLLLGFAIDLLSPGLVFPTVAWVGAVIGLMAPPMIVGMAGWWEVAAIVGGLCCLAAEIFVLPGFGLFGVLGVLSLFAGLVGTFVPKGPTFPGDPSATEGMVTGLITVLLAGVTAFIGLYFTAKRFETFPILNRLVLTSVSGEQRESSERDAMLGALREPEHDRFAVGDEGVASTALRPSGNALINDELVDVVSDLGYISKGERVRVVRVEGMRVVVERSPGGEA